MLCGETLKCCRPFFLLKCCLLYKYYRRSVTQNRADVILKV